MLGKIMNNGYFLGVIMALIVYGLGWLLERYVPKLNGSLLGFFLGGFIPGVVMNLVVNGPHIACCHTVVTLGLGCLQLGVLSGLVNMIVNTLASKVSPTFNNMLMSTILGYFSMCFVYWAMGKYSNYRSNSRLKEFKEKHGDIIIKNAVDSVKENKKEMMVAEDTGEVAEDGAPAGEADAVGEAAAPAGETAAPVEGNSDVPLADKESS